MSDKLNKKGLLTKLKADRKSLLLRMEGLLLSRNEELLLSRSCDLHTTYYSQMQYINLLINEIERGDFDGK